MNRQVTEIAITKVDLVEDTLTPAYLKPGAESTEGYGVRVTMADGSFRHNECMLLRRNPKKQFAHLVKEAKRLSRAFKVDWTNLTEMEA